MASITHFLFISLLFHSIFLINCDDGRLHDNLLQGINRYRSSLRLPSLTHNDGVQCLAHNIADRFNNQPCPTTTTPTQPKVSDYTELITKCKLNTTTLKGAQILPICFPRSKSRSAQLLTHYTASPYATYLNDTRFSDIGISYVENWSIVIVIPVLPEFPAFPAFPATPATPAIPTIPGIPGTPILDNLLQGINQYRSSLRLPSLTKHDGVECLAHDIAGRFKNQPCPTTTTPTQPKVSDYTDLITKCKLNTIALKGAQILPICFPKSKSQTQSQFAQLLTHYTISPYATYLNNTHFSGIGISYVDNWSIVIVLPVLPAYPAFPAFPAIPVIPAIPGIPGKPPLG